MDTRALQERFPTERENVMVEVQFNAPTFKWVQYIVAIEVKRLLCAYHVHTLGCTSCEQQTSDDLPMGTRIIRYST